MAEQMSYKALLDAKERAFETLDEVRHRHLGRYADAVDNCSHLLADWQVEEIASAGAWAEKMAEAVREFDDKILEAAGF